ncbi:Hypothetical predicted protein [Mytilus galloprovincialis]|uniref:Uncharacterized protein n=1 Tax=Mytilus galloprovincialis TaxID=29158 RepID=A0A8B6BI11_MYTGA|nr:Hypothetical predicted protein [Mytilus galloprovincialis]
MYPKELSNGQTNDSFTRREGCLVIHFIQGCLRTQARRVVTEILNFDLERKHRLVEIYTDILHLADDLKQERGLLQELNTEFGDFEKEIQNSKEILLEAECPIIVAGK